MPSSCCGVSLKRPRVPLPTLCLGPFVIQWWALLLDSKNIIVKQFPSTAAERCLFVEAFGPSLLGWAVSFQASIVWKWRLLPEISVTLCPNDCMIASQQGWDNFAGEVTSLSLAAVLANVRMSPPVRVRQQWRRLCKSALKIPLCTSVFPPWCVCHIYCSTVR